MYAHLCKGLTSCNDAHMYYEILRSYAGIIRIRFMGIISATVTPGTPANKISMSEASADAFSRGKYTKNPYKTNCNKFLTLILLTAKRNALPLHTVISFSVINYVVSMRHPRESDEVSFSFIYT